MSMLVSDPLTQLAFALNENKGVVAVLLGSGLSRAAGIPSGWDITLDLIRRVALAQGVKDQSDWAGWYRDKFGKEPDYSALIRDLAFSPAERRSILHSYIEPTEKDRAEGRKVPTAAHRAIADLVSSGHIRVIITTNFDRLMENALRERDVEPTIIASEDALKGAEPFCHSSCYILKLHGDYKDTRIRNTEIELSKYPRKYRVLLDRILDEHGLIICGWSGEWDEALRAAFLRAPNRRYSVFWTDYCNNLKEPARELAKHRGAHIIPINGADNFFCRLSQRVEILQQTGQQNPISVEILVNITKHFLAKPEFYIQLDELFTQQTWHVIASLDNIDGYFQPHSDDQIAINSYINKCSSITEALASMAGVLGRWGNDNEFRLMLDVIRSLHAHSDKNINGYCSWIDALFCPTVLVATGYGLGLVCAGRWKKLYGLLDASVKRKQNESVRMIEILTKQRTPSSDHLLSVFEGWGKRFVGRPSDFKPIFDHFEMLCSLAHFEKNDKSAVKKEFDKNQLQGWTFMPIGRIGLHRENAKHLLTELQSAPLRDLLIQAGFAKGDPEVIDLFIKNFMRATQMR